MAIFDFVGFKFLLKAIIHFLQQYFTPVQNKYIFSLKVLFLKRLKRPFYKWSWNRKHYHDLKV